MDVSCCENCAFSRRGVVGMLECRRHAARFSQGDRDDGFPQVLATEWCGEFSSEDTDNEAAFEFALPGSPDVVACARELSLLFAELQLVLEVDESNDWVVTRLYDVLEDAGEVIDIEYAVAALMAERRTAREKEQGS